MCANIGVSQILLLFLQNYLLFVHFPKFEFMLLIWKHLQGWAYQTQDSLHLLGTAVERAYQDNE